MRCAALVAETECHGTKWKPCMPPQMMKVTIKKYNKRYGIVKCDAKAYVGSDLVCEAQLTLAMGS